MPKVRHSVAAAVNCREDDRLKNERPLATRPAGVFLIDKRIGSLNCEVERHPRPIDQAARPAYPLLWPGI